MPEYRSGWRMGRSLRMPLRFEPEHSQPYEPVTAVRPSVAETEPGGSIHLDLPYDKASTERRSDKGTLILKIVVGGIFAYVAVIGAGLCAMMFPRQTHEIVRTVQQGVAIVRPEPTKQRVIAMPSATVPEDTSVKAATTSSRKQHRRTVSASFGKVEIVDSNRSHTATPRPPTPSVTVSVGESKPATEPAN